MHDLTLGRDQDEIDSYNDEAGECEYCGKRAPTRPVRALDEPVIYAICSQCQQEQSDWFRCDDDYCEHEEDDINPYDFFDELEYANWLALQYMLEIEVDPRW